MPQTVYGRKTTEEIQERNFAGKPQRKVKALVNSHIFLKHKAVPLKQCTCTPSERK